MELHIGDQVRAAKSLLKDFPHLESFIFQVEETNPLYDRIWVELSVITHRTYDRYGITYPGNSLIGARFTYWAEDLVSL